MCHCIARLNQTHRFERANVSQNGTKNGTIMEPTTLQTEGISLAHRPTSVGELASSPNKMEESPVVQTQVETEA